MRKEILQGIAILGVVSGVVVAEETYRNTFRRPFPDEVKIGEIETEGCKADIYRSERVEKKGWAAITYPAEISGKSSIVYIAPNYENNQWVRAHETGHVQQFCEKGVIVFSFEYLLDKNKLERDADKRAEMILNGEGK